MVAIVDDASTIVDIGADGIGTGAGTHTAVLLGHGLVGVVHQGVADVVDVYIVGFTTVVAVAGTFVGTDAYTFVDPGFVFLHVALIKQHFLDMGVHVIDVLHRETACEGFKVIVRAFQLAKPVIGTSTAHRMGSKVGIITNEKDELKVALGVGVDAVDVVLDLGVVVATDFAQADHGGGTARLVFPIHERLHGFHVLVGADD